jgi:RNA polymerase sigma factor (sigma-70 family)
VSAQPLPLASAVRRPYDRRSDTELVAGFRGGDEGAFAALTARHGPALRRYARHVLRAQPALAEDVVQEALMRAHRALRRDDRHVQVRAYLFRVVRNCCLDELGRLRTDSVALHLLTPGEEPAALGASPHEQTVSRDTTLTALADVADLPATQRHALVRREIDGVTHEELARELGVSVQATKNLVHRARENLARTAEARDAACADVRHDLLVAHDRRRRPPMAALRHAALCRDCRAFRTALKSGRRRLAVLAPAPLAFGLVAVALGGSKKAAAGAAATVAAAGGVYGLETRVFSAGEPAPIRVDSVVVPGGLLARGAPVPARTAVVTGRLTVPGGGRVARAALACPRGMRVAGLVPRGGEGLAHGFAPETLLGVSTVARVLVAGDGAERRVTVAVLCRR